jgi:hypothetical protein
MMDGDTAAAVDTVTWDPPQIKDLLESLQVNAEGREAISRMPQRSPEWKAARYGRLTASNFGAAIGHMTNTRRDQLLKDMVWPEGAGIFGYAQKFAQYGNENESVARDLYVTDRQRKHHPQYENQYCNVFETGLLVSVEHGWLGASPDFVVEETSNCRIPDKGPTQNCHHLNDPYIIDHSLLSWMQSSRKYDDELITPPPGADIVQGCGEIKCPAYGDRVLYSSQTKHAKHGFPEYYYDQIQGAMALNNWPWCDVIVYTPSKSEVTRFHRDKVYWDTVLFPGLRAFYFDRFLPLLHLRVTKKLEYGCIHAIGSPTSIKIKRIKKEKEEDFRKIPKMEPLPASFEHFFTLRK